MSKVDFKELLDAGVHFGHLRRKWNPKMAPYIFMERNGIHIIDLHKTAAKLEEASAALSQIAKSGKKIMFVATKKQAKDVVAERAKNINMPFVTERWPGGMLTNFVTIRKAVRKMAAIDKMGEDGTMAVLSKRERLQIARQRQKLEKNLGSIADLTRLPAAIFVVDIMKEHIAIAEAKKLGIPTFAIVDTNSNPTLVDFAIPANDDATKSIDKIMEIVTAEVAKGLAERKEGKDKAKADAAAQKTDKPEAKKEEKKEEVKKEEKKETKAKEETKAKKETKEEAEAESK